MAADEYTAYPVKKSPLTRSVHQAGPVVGPQMAFKLCSFIVPSNAPLAIDRIFCRASRYSIWSSPGFLSELSNMSCLKKGIALESFVRLNSMTCDNDFTGAFAFARYRFTPSLNSYCKTVNSGG